MNLQRRRARNSQEHKPEWVVVVLAMLVVLVGYLALSGRTLGGHTQDTGSSSQVDLHRQPYSFDYIKYPKNIDNITQFNQEIKAQIDNVLTDYSLKDIKLISVLSNKVQDIYQTESLRGLSKKVEEYQNLQQILRNKYEDSTSIQAQIHSEITLYSSCRQEVADFILSLKGKRMPFDIDQDIKATQRSLSKNSQTQYQLGEQLKTITDKYKPLIQDVEQLIATNQIKRKNLNFNEQQIREAEQKNQKIIGQIKAMKDRLPEMSINKDRIDNTTLQNEAMIQQLAIELDGLEESVFYLRLQIEEKKMSINLPAILKDLNVDTKQEFADKVKERLMVLQRMYSHELVNKQQQQELEKEITKLQNKYQEIMELVNQLKQKAFLQYQKGYKHQIQQKETELARLLLQKDSLTSQAESLRNENILLNNELITLKKNEADYLLRIDQLLIEKEQNDLSLASVDDQPEDIARQQHKLTSQLKDLIAQRDQQIQENKDRISELVNKEEHLVRQRELQVAQHRSMRLTVMDFSRDLNKKIYECQARLKYLNSVVANGKNYLQEVNRFYSTLTELDREIATMLLLDQPTQ